MALAAVLAAGGAPLSAQSDDAAAIREARARSNAAIARHDTDAILAELDSAFQITAGSGQLLQGRAAMGGAFQAQFDAFEDVLYVRTPETVEVADDGARGFERGRWVGTRTTSDGAQRVGGSYAAAWTKVDGAWKLRSELFVTLFCEGAGCS